MLGKIWRRWHYGRLAQRLIEEHGYERYAFEDRDVLERIIIPRTLSDYNPKKILDIGREDYQSWYNEYYQGRELWTLDRIKHRKRFGAEHHITDDVANVDRHFQPDYFDFILMNGVFGWGLNEPEAIETAFAALYKILKPGGLFILGWNDLEGTVPVPLAKIKALKSFSPERFAPLDSQSFRCPGEGRHTYNFYRKAKRA